MSGYSVALANGWPDMGFLTMTEMTRIAAMMASADDGYGNALSTIRTVQEYMKTGVAGIHIEDQRFPKRCGHIAGKTILPRDEAIRKFLAAVDTRNRLDPDFVLIARTDAYGAVGGNLEEAIWRGRAYADAGVDLVWCELSNAAREPAIAHRPGDARDPSNPAAGLQLLVVVQVERGPEPVPVPGARRARLHVIFITLFAAHAGMYAA